MSRTTKGGKRISRKIQEIEDVAHGYGFIVTRREIGVSIRKRLGDFQRGRRSVWYIFNTYDELDIFLHGYYAGAVDKEKAIKET